MPDMSHCLVVQVQGRRGCPERELGASFKIVAKALSAITLIEYPVYVFLDGSKHLRGVRRAFALLCITAKDIYEKEKVMRKGMISERGEWTGQRRE